MKKILIVLTATLALNFLAIAAAMGWLFQSKHLDKARVAAIREIVFPATQPQQPNLSESAAATTQPGMTLEELLAKKLGKPASEQVEFIQRTFDARMTQLEHRQRELEGLARQIELARQKLDGDRAELDTRQRKFDQQTRESAALQSDKGFADALNLYTSMPGKQAKDIFMTLDDATVRTYLQSMETGTAKKIVREFKSAEEIKRIQRILEQMRQPQIAPATQASVKE